MTELKREQIDQLFNWIEMDQITELCQWYDELTADNRIAVMAWCWVNADRCVINELLYLEASARNMM